MFVRRKNILLKSLCFAVLCFALVTSPALAEVTVLDVVQDTDIASKNGDQNTGDSSYCIVGSHAFEGTRRILLQFDLTAVPVGAHINAATLRMYYYMPGGDSAVDMPLTIHRLTRPWQEMTALWDTMGTASDDMVYATNVLPGGFSVSNEWYTWDITSLVQEWVSEGHANHGLAVHGREELPAAYRYFSSKDQGVGQGAELIIDWQPATLIPISWVYLPLVMR